MQTIAGRYQIAEEVGRGGMGVVYRARDTKLDREVALKQLKVLEFGSQSVEAVGRFMREARVMGSLLHPAVVVLYDVLELGDDLYLVMEYYPSRNLSSVVSEGGPLSEAEVVRMGARLASGLQLAHSKGIVHRDIKPENVLLGEDGAKLTDFGVARIAEGTRQQVTRLTQSGFYVGTPGYMAPEVLKGGEAVPSSDVFCLGLVLYYALAGRDPYQGTDLAILAYQVVYEPLDLGSLSISDELASILEWATAKAPEQRPTAGELQQALERPDAAVPSAGLGSGGPAPAARATPAPIPAAALSSVSEPTEAEPPPNPALSVAPLTASPPPVSHTPPSLTPAPPPGLPRYPPVRGRSSLGWYVLGAILAAVALLGLVVGALVVARRSGREARSGGASPGFQVHESALGYQGAIPRTWKVEPPPPSGPRTEYLWAPDQNAGIVVANLGPWDPYLYSHKEEELVDKVKTQIGLEGGYQIVDATVSGEPNAYFGTIKAAKVNFEIAGEPGKPRYLAELYLFNASDQLWAVVGFARRAELQAFEATFSNFERTFAVRP